MFLIVGVSDRHARARTHPAFNSHDWAALV